MHYLDLLNTDQCIKKKGWDLGNVSWSTGPWGGPALPSSGPQTLPNFLLGQPSV